MTSLEQRAAQRSREVLESAWISPPGYACPNRKKYEWQWLWDSCFHAIAWGALGDQRAVTEMESLLASALPNGFLPNMLYHTNPWLGFLAWRRKGRSTITQPPMYGHALRVLHERGFDVEHLLEPATRTLNYLIDSRLDASTGLVQIFHPWESGCDDSPRWDKWIATGYTRFRWNIKKLLLVQALKVRGGAVDSRKFKVCSSMFNALTAFNALELAALTGDKELEAKANNIAAALEKTWNAQSRTWADVFPGTGKTVSAIPTHEAFLPLLVVRNEAQRERAWRHLMDEKAFLRPHGIAGVSIAEPSYNPSAYWRGGSWPQVVYLLWLAAVRENRSEREVLEPLIINGVLTSDLAEYWNPETGEGCGAKPQSWSAVIMQMFDAD